MIVIPGPASLELGERIAERMGVGSHPVDHRIFPDGESYIRLTTPVEGEPVVVVQTTFPNPDRGVMQLLLMVRAAKDLGAERVVCVVPYLAYSRQDKRFLEGEALSLDTVVALLGDAGGDDLIVVDIHNEESLGRLRVKTSLRIVNLSAMPLLAGHLRELGFDGAYSLSPDAGAKHHADAAAGVLGGSSGFFEKVRDRKTGEIDMVAKGIDISGGDAVVFDDIISSGGTTAAAVRGLKNQGAERVAAACTHGLFMGDAERRILEAGADLLLSTDTVRTRLSQVTVAGLLAGHLEKIA
jgi:ribose-phosphate pyrophosphokinase